MEKTSKLLCILLSICMLVSLMTACGKQAPVDQPTATATPSSSATPEPTVGPPVTLTVLAAAGGEPKLQNGNPALTDNPVAKQIEKDLNIKLEWDIVTGDGNAQMMTRMASNQIGDIIVNLQAQVFSKMLEEKMIAPLEGLIDQYGPNIKATYGDSILNFLKKDDGHLYHLTQNYVNITPDSKFDGNGNAVQIRKDVYEAIGSPKIETLDDYYNALVAIKNHPDLQKSFTGESTFPVSGFKRTWGNLLECLVTSGGSGTNKWIEENGQIKYWVKAPWAVEVFKFLNKIYNEGLLDKDSFVQDPQTWELNKRNTGRVLTELGAWWHLYGAPAAFEAAGVKDATKNMYYMNFVITIPGGGKPQLKSVNSVGGDTTVITENCKNKEAAIKLFNYFATPEMNMVAMNGAKGIMWDMVDGKPVMKPEYMEKFRNGAEDNEFSLLAGYRCNYEKFVGTNQGLSPWGTMWILKDDPTGNPVFEQRDAAVGPYWVDTTAFAGIDQGLVEDTANALAAIQTKLNDDIYEAVFAKTEADCIKAYEKFVQEINALGAEAVEAAVTANYQKNLKKLGK